MEERNYFMVRAQSSSEEIFELLEKNGTVGVGWSNVNFCSFTYEEIAEEVANKYDYNNRNRIAPQVAGKKLNEVRRFKRIKKGDIIIVPHYSEVWIAEATGEELYDESTKGLDIANQKKVKYFLNNKEEFIAIPRTELSEGLSRRLRVRGSTVAGLGEFRDEIEKILTEIKENGAFAYINDYTEKRNEAAKEFKKALLKNIQKGQTHLETGGIGFEKLVEELLKCEGFETKILPKNSFRGEGDVDIAATIRHTLFSDEFVYFVQVKHHSGISNEKGVDQLIKAREEKLQNEYSNATYVFLTSADIAEEARCLAGENGIICIDGNDLVECIFENLNKLDNGTLNKLHIFNIPQILK